MPLMVTNQKEMVRNQIDYTLCSQRWRNSIKSARTRVGADCGSDRELIAKFRLKLKKVGKTTRPFRYDLNQIPYNYTVEVTNRFKELDLIECLKNYGWRFVTLYRKQSEKAMATHSSTLAWEIPGMEELGGLQSMGLRRVGHD